MHWLFRQRFNKNSSNNFKDFTPLEIDEFINNSTYVFIEENAYREDSKRFDYINNLIVTNPEQPALSPITLTGNKYEINLSALKYPLYKIKNLIVYTNCGNILIADTQIVGHDKINKILDDHHQQPNKKWKRLIAALAKSSSQAHQNLYIYSTTGFTVNSVTIEYVRKPKRVFFGGYDTIEYLTCDANCNQYYSASTPPVDSEIDERHHDLIIDYAVREAQRTLQNTAINLTENKIIKQNG